MSNNLSERHYGGTFCLAKALLAEGTNAATIKTTNAADYAIDGLLYTKAATDNIAMTALAEQVDLTTCLYLVQINASGTVSIVKGEEVLTEELANDEVVAKWPDPAADNCPLGGFRIVTSGATFTSGTTDLGAAGITDTFYDFFAVPPAGLTS